MADLGNEAASAPAQHGFNPYANNGGCTLGVAGADYAILAGDTRSTSGYNINSRYISKVWRLGGKDESTIVLSTVGFAADGTDLRDRLNSIVTMYKFQHGKQISLEACAHRLSTLLYSKRFFPYQVQAILGGLDKHGVGAVYAYDPAGTYARETARAAGVGGSLMEPFLDSQFQFKNQYPPGSRQWEALQAKAQQPISKDHAVSIVKDAFGIVTERHIEVGDGLQMMIITTEGVQETFTMLKRD